MYVLSLSLSLPALVAYPSNIMIYILVLYIYIRKLHEMSLLRVPVK